MLASYVQQPPLRVVFRHSDCLTGGVRSPFNIVGLSANRFKKWSGERRRPARVPAGFSTANGK